MEKKVVSFISKYNMIRPGEKVLVGFSGGADSMCLLLILKNIIGMPIFGGAKLYAVYIEHGIRGEESIDDGRFCEDVCKEKGIPFEMIKIDAPGFARKTGLSLEEAARVKRYEALRNAKEKVGAEKIAVAHHADDCAETVLFNLARGTGISGLAGISPVRGDIIRPLLCCSKEEILAYLKEQGADFRTDSTNADTDYSRNKIRMQVLPLLKEINSEAARHIAEAAEDARASADYIDEETLIAEKACLSGENALDCKILSVYPEYIQGKIIQDMAGKLVGRRDISRVHIDAARKLISAGTGKRVELPRGLKIRKEHGRLIFDAPEREISVKTVY